MAVFEPKNQLHPAVLSIAVMASTAFPSSTLSASETFTFDNDRSLTVGFGYRGSMNIVDDGAPSGSSKSIDFNMDNLEIRLAASISENIKGIVNISKNNDSDIKLLDAIAHLALSPELNIWAGRMLPPSDRSNLNGPFFISSYSYPIIVARYPSKFTGRDNGVTLWGKLLDKHLVYSFGAFEGHNNFEKASSEDDNLLYAGRLQYDFWSPNLAPAYLTAGTFYGQDLFSIGFAWQYQKDGVGSAEEKGDFTAWNIDVLFEKNLGGYVIDLEGAYYDFDTDDTSDVVPGLLTSTPGDTDNVGGLKQGKAYLASIALMLPQKVGWGQIQPIVRYQKFDQDSTPTGGASAPFVDSLDIKQIDYGLNYVINGHNTRISATYSNLEISNADDTDAFVLGLQYQF
ncbi:MAG: porin [Gammaproteobacteria bacterium]|nr:MAG: porin [Gammaproteobacteria bacterium]